MQTCRDTNTLFTSVSAGRHTHTHTEGRKLPPPHTHTVQQRVLNSITGRAGTMGEVYSQQRHEDRRRHFVLFTSLQSLSVMESAAGVGPTWTDTTQRRSNTSRTPDSDSVSTRTKNPAGPSQVRTASVNKTTHEQLNSRTHNKVLQGHTDTRM